MTTIEQILTSMSGVWSGTYTVLRPNGEVVERFPSRQEGLMEGNDWTEKVTYLKPDTAPEVQYFHATVKGDEVAFDHPNMWGETNRAGGLAIVFTFGWKDRPHERIVEMSMPTPSYRTRLWQHFENDKLSKVTLIEEQRLPEEEPERWYES